MTNPREMKLAWLAIAEKYCEERGLELLGACHTKHNVQYFEAILRAIYTSQNKLLFKLEMVALSKENLKSLLKKQAS
jgi:hypothetical protein